MEQDPAGALAGCGKLTPVIPGRAESASPESRTADCEPGSGFRAHRFAVSRNDRGEFFSELLEDFPPKWTPVRRGKCDK